MTRRTEANEGNPSVANAYTAWQEQIEKGETMGVIQMYEDAYREALARECAQAASIRSGVSRKTDWTKTQNRLTHAALVYQGGLANVFETGRLIAGVATYERKRLLQSSFSVCEAFALGLMAAGVDLVALYCNEAGDILQSDWYSGLDNAPFSSKFNPIGEHSWE